MKEMQQHACKNAKQPIWKWSRDESNVVGDFSLKTTVSNHHGYKRLWQHWTRRMNTHTDSWSFGSVLLQCISVPCCWVFLVNKTNTSGTLLFVQTKVWIYVCFTVMCLESTMTTQCRQNICRGCIIGVCAHQCSWGHLLADIQHYICTGNFQVCSCRLAHSHHCHPNTHQHL